ncbi:tetratricopeptide repeat protein [Roseofilum casamattae]|uniref:Tetratricopeptide repeat protein n=1 Tax=Roseofilum casamattae BLCC-M143 TaxID=3022442 RepID=A0ABT7BYE5_9CYAN|nr:hypothetical protein [Roseofilum casamattae]MDJ1183471.1 hypothetical protein [Roseofilum casamattae BLCC-M143]
MDKTVISATYAEKAQESIKNYNYVEAISHFDLALTYDPNNISLWIQRGCACTHLHHYQKALWSFEQALTLSPDDSSLHLFRGVCLHHLKQYDRAYQSYDRGLGRNSSNLLTGLKRKWQALLANWELSVSASS